MSGIYIPGMEMPDRCGHCRFANAFDCTVTGSFISTHSIRQPNCPLVPVPDHGRLIDADATVSLLRDLGSRDYRREKGTICDAIKMVMHEQYTPTIIQADPAKEGEG